MAKIRDAAHVGAATFAAMLAPQPAAAEDAGGSLPGHMEMTVDGPVLVKPDGMTLYSNAAENALAPKLNWQCTNTVTRTTDDQQSGIGPRPNIGFKLLKSCLDKYRPYAAPAGAQAVGDFMIVDRPDGTRQWAYRGNPLYTSTKDKEPGERNAMGLGFFAIFRGGLRPTPVEVRMPTGLKLLRRQEGLVIASTATERAIYTPTRGKVGKPSMGRDDFMPVLAPALAQASGDWSIVEFGPGQRQYAFKGQPLFWAATGYNELEIDKVTGWRPVVVVPKPKVPGAISSRMTLAGTVYTNNRGRTLYTYNCNAGGFTGRISCEEPGDPAGFMVALCGSGEECAKRWEPYFAPGSARRTGEFSVIEITYPMFTQPRGELYPKDAPKRKVWAYRGKPLFTYYEDEKPGDIWGDGVGGIWGSTFSALVTPGGSATNFDP